MDPSASVSTSILARLKVGEQEAWSRAVCLFQPLVLIWCRQAGLQEEDAADVCQEVFRALARNVERFDRDQGRHSFRGWLRGITRKQLLAFWRRRGIPAEGGTTAHKRWAEVSEPLLDESSAAEASSERHELLRRALGLIRNDVEERTWQAFWLVVVEGQAAGDVATALGISLNSVYLAKGRLLRRLREEFCELIVE
ncbi:MAG TPA: sigma-70 family RNA polymerase sigma factor [Pirellulales bacterium]|nr:sigma-70 family RNA polymerase sigma factor [Pirellulales bacterium]